MFPKRECARSINALPSDLFYPFPSCLVILPLRLCAVKVGESLPPLTVLGCAAFFIQQDGKKKWWKLDHNFSTASAKSCSLGVM